jgi:hypothetical protein
VNERGGSHGCACGMVTLGPLGTPRVVNGTEHRWGKPCRPAALAANDTTPPEREERRRG